MRRDFTRVRERVVVPPTLAPRPKATERPGQPEPRRSVGRDATTPSRTPPSASDSASDKAAAAPRSMAPLAPPVDSGRAGRWIVPIAAGLIAAVAGWWVGATNQFGIASPSALLAPGLLANDKLAQAREALEAEQQKSGKLAGELAGVWRVLTSQTAALADQAALTQELTDLRERLHQTEGQLETYQELLAQERSANRGVEERPVTRRDGAPDRGRNPKPIATPAAMASLPTAASKMPGPAPSPAIDKQAAPPANANERAAVVADEKPATPAAGPPAADRDSAPSTTPTTVTSPAISAPSVPDPPPLPAMDRQASASPPAQSANEKPAATADNKPATVAATPTALGLPGQLDLARLMARASLLLGQGDIGAARIVLERAAEEGSTSALFALAETYDPAILSAWGTLGTRGDVTKAQDLYARAFAGGIAEAKDRLNALH